MFSKRTNFVINAICLSFILLLLFSDSALAKRYYIDKIHVYATVLPDGSLQIEEARTYRFKGKFSWADYWIPMSKIGSITNFSLSEEKFEYKKDNSEEEGTYEIQRNQNQFYVKWHYRARNETRTFILRYIATDVVTLYDDIAELYYKFVGETNQKDIGKVDISISLPQTDLTSDVRAWSHGPLWGELEFQPGKINLFVSPLPRHQYWEARVVFPKDWITQSNRIVSGNHLPIVLAEEAKWAKEANTARERAIEERKIQAENEQKAWPIVWILIGVGVIGLLFMYSRFGRSFEVPYTQEIDSEIPKDQHPTIINCLYNNKHIYGTALSTTLFELARKGIIKVEQKETSEKKWWQGKGAEFDFKLNRGKWNEEKKQLTDFENDLIEFIFEDLGGGAEQVNSNIFKKNSGKMRKWFEKWKKILKAHFSNISIYDKESVRGTVYACILSVFVIIGGIVVLISLGKPGIFAILSGIVFFALSFFILRFTKEMKLQRKKWNALRKYLKKYHFVQDHSHSWQQQIGHYLIFGIALGAGTKAITKMIELVPQEQYAAIFPWYVAAIHGGSSPAEFASAMTSVINVATATVSSAAGVSGGASAGAGAGAGGAAGGAG